MPFPHSFIKQQEFLEWALTKGNKLAHADDNAGHFTTKHSSLYKMVL